METRLLAAFQAEREAIARQRKTDRELKAFFSGGALVFSGVLFAALYALLTHQI